MITLKLAWAVTRKKPIHSIITLLSIIISSALLTAICCFASSLIAAISPTDPDYVSNLMVVVTLVIVVAVISVVLIRAVFAISFSERVNTLGLLSTVGMSTRNKIALISIESAIYSLLGGVIGTALGRFITVIYMNYMSNLDMREASTFKYDAPFSTLLWSFLLTVAVTMFASLKPMLRATRLSIINSLKADVSVNVSLYEGTFEKIMSNRFGRIGRLAGQNFDNNAPRYRAVSITLPCAQIIFVSIYSLFMWEYWERGINNAYGEPFFASAMAIGYILTAIALLGAFLSATANINGRKREFAMFKSLGLSDRDMFKLMSCESIFVMFYATVFGFIGSFLSVLGQYIFFWTSAAVQWFHFPWREWFIFVGINAVFCMFFAFYSTVKIRKINIISSMK